MGHIKHLVLNSFNENALEDREDIFGQKVGILEQELKDHAEFLVLREMKEQAAQMVAVIHTIEQKVNVGEKRKRAEAQFDEVFEQFETSRKKSRCVEGGEEELEDTESDEETAIGVSFIRIAALES